MGYIGQAPANKVVKTADIEDSAITSAKILDGTIVNADVNASAAIAESKLTVSSFDDNQIQNNIALLGFKTAVNGDLAKYNLVDQIIDEYEDNSGIDAGNSTNEALVSGSYSGDLSPTHDADATGTDGDDTWYKWTDTASTGSFAPAAGGDYEVLVVAGGGGGGHGDGGSLRAAGGGGAGGYRTGTLTLTVQAYTVTVGAGGAGSSGTGSNAAVKGGDSIFSTITSTGGGRGLGHAYAGTTDSDGGSGGGGSWNVNTGASGNEGSHTPVEGYDGGDGNDSHPNHGGGGGGGASAVGANSSTSTGGAGGAGTANSITGSSVTYAGGGGGGGTSTGGAGGAGGGGAGQSGTSNSSTAGTANTGGGGGGAGDAGDAGGNGGSGIVIIKGATPVETVGDLTLQSTDTTASTANPDYANMICLMENAAGTATLNTDIKGYVSEDSGVTFTQGTFVDEGTWGTNKKIIAFHDLDISAQSGSSMCYKITTHNQSGSKETKIHATSIGWR